MGQLWFKGLSLTDKAYLAEHDVTRVISEMTAKLINREAAQIYVTQIKAEQSADTENVRPDNKGGLQSNNQKRRERAKQQSDENGRRDQQFEYEPDRNQPGPSGQRQSYRPPMR